MKGVRSLRAITTSTKRSAPKPPPTADKRRQLDITLIVGGVGLASVLGLAVYRGSRSASSSAVVSAPAFPTASTSQFTVDGTSSRDRKTLNMLSPEQATQRLRENEETFTLARPGNPVVRYDTSAVASNSVCPHTHPFSKDADDRHVAYRR